MHLSKTCPDIKKTAAAQGWSTCWIALSSNKGRAKSRPQGSQSNAFLSPGHCFLLFQALWLHSCLNTLWLEREVPWAPVLVMFVYAPRWLVPAQSHVTSWQFLCKTLLQKSTISFINRDRQNGLLFPKPANIVFLCSAPGLPGRKESIHRGEGKVILSSVGVRCCQCTEYP